VSTHTQSHAAPHRRAARRSAARRRTVRRRRLVAAVVAAAVALLGVVELIVPLFHHAVQEIALPLRHEDIIRQQARDKGLEPALIAAVIYAESHFRDNQRSAAGAEGLMQLTPATATYIARKSGGIRFEVNDLATPQVNIAYGAYYLRYLLHRYAGNEALALAAYNGGEGNVDRWLAAAHERDQSFRVQDIPFPETRAYVRRVQAAKAQYRTKYAHELGG
jgi:soluble lytic murein transglycosylase